MLFVDPTYAGLCCQYHARRKIKQRPIGESRSHGNVRVLLNETGERLRKHKHPYERVGGVSKAVRKKPAPPRPANYIR